MKKIGLVITDGVGFRNFILSDFINKKLHSKNSITIFSCIPIENYKTIDDRYKVIEMDVYKEGSYTWLFRKLKELTHLYNHAKTTFGIRDNINKTYSKSKTRRGKIIRFLHKFTGLIHSESLITVYYYLQKATFKKNEYTKTYKKIFEENQVDILLFTHQRPPYIAPIIYAAQKLKITTCAFIFSWDNIASKGRMAGDFDHYLVWSDLMRDELLQFYANVSANQIHVIGTPQFEPFVMKNYGYSKEELCQKFELDPHKPILFFTCNDANSLNDPLYLDALAKAINDKKLVEEVNLIVRTSPADDGSRFNYLVEKYDFIKWNKPIWKLTRTNHQEPWSQRVPTKEDVDDLKSLLEHCDININVLSTITLDSFIFNKPVVNPVFGNENNNLFDDQKFLRYKHLEMLVDSNSSDIVKTETEYIIALNNLLSGIDNKAKERKEFLSLEISKPLEGTSTRIVEILLKLTEKG